MELVVFYGRRQTVSILHSYIERNLVDRGGMIHKVHFVVHTEDAADLAFLDQLLARQPRYVRVALEARNQMDFSVHYEWLPRDRLMFKIDDDVVFIEDGAFEAMLEEKLRNRFLFVSANVVNHPVLSTVHAQMAALVPYAPANGRDPWIRGDPLRRKHGAFGDGPDLAKFNDGACTWGSWKCAAVSHENFLHDANAGQLDRYHFPVWDFHAYDTAVRWSINAFVFNTDDILGKINSTDDEQLIAVEFSKQRNWHSGAAGKAIMAHYAYYPQREGLNTNTGLIDRYRALAKRMCGYVLNEDGEYNVEY
ncbi:hypothetical protein BC828DRAFT_350410 [Blastocladiella britannica]|nr:hypothetical protein BC828DRAFT_350410 [Blastocladiella britannica]